MGLINCPGACSARYLTNSIVNLSATPMGTVSLHPYQSANGIWVVGDGTLWVPDTTSNTVTKLLETGSETGMVFGSSGSGNGQFSQPIAVLVVGSVIYVADLNNFRVQYFDLGGIYQGKWGSFGTGNGQFRGPWGMAADSGGNIYVVDGGGSISHRIQKFTSTGTFITKWTTAGTPQYIFYSTATDELYVTEQGFGTNTRVEVFNTSGVSQRHWGSFGNNNDQFNNPLGIVVSSDGAFVWVVDQNNSRVQKFQSDGTYVSQFSIDEVQGGRGLGIDSDGNFYVGETAVYKYAPDGTFLFSFPFRNTQFAGWSGDVPAGHENDNPLAITMDRTRNIIATFS